jgi:hypothetical protein
MLALKFTSGEGAVSIKHQIGDIHENQFAIASIDAYTEARPYPYDTTVNLAVLDGGAPDTFGAWTISFPIGTYNFGDNPNWVHIAMIIIEIIPANDTYIIEFARSTDGIAFQPIGAIRFVRAAPQQRSFYLGLPLSPINNDIDGLYARLKDASGGGITVTYSVEVKRWFPPSGARLQSAGVWPWG